MLLAGLEDAGILQRILDFLMFHDPKLKPFRGRMCSGHGELVFVYEGQPYRAVKWHPGKHFGRCAKRSCGCCRAHMRRRDIGCQECCCAFIVKSTCQLLKTASVVNAWRTYRENQKRKEHAWETWMARERDFQSAWSAKRYTTSPVIHEHSPERS